MPDAEKYEILVLGSGEAGSGQLGRWPMRVIALRWSSGNGSAVRARISRACLARTLSTPRE
jgi:hypothetical protein